MKPNNSNDDETCYACYGIHYLNGKMRLNGEKAKCYGFTVKQNPNAQMIEQSRKMDLSLKPGNAIFTIGKMRRLGTPPFGGLINLHMSEKTSTSVQPTGKLNPPNAQPSVNEAKNPTEQTLTAEKELSGEEMFIKYRDLVLICGVKVGRSFKTTFLNTVDDLPGKVARSTGKFVRSTINTGSALSNFVLTSLGWNDTNS